MNKTISVYMFPSSSKEVDSAKNLLGKNPEITIYSAASSKTVSFDHSVLLIHSTFIIDNPQIQQLLWKKSFLEPRRY